ncbi:esterase/lipase family protein [Nocardia sp. NPDC049149]|uniref:esterase/lipase family protein n=1 Tax=Nocardia sp. NPDC049149 TaxID=3364315 RepID=UPI003719F5DF
MASDTRECAVRRSLLCGAVLILTAFTATTGMAAADAPDGPAPIEAPESWSADGDLVPAPPGANDWSCRPSVAHPRPIVLAHGIYENRLGSWLAMSPALTAAGYCVYALDYGRGLGGVISGVGSVSVSAEEISAFTDRVLAATGAQQVDFVGHSLGGVLPRYYMKFLGGANKVNTLVGIAPDNHGTTWGLFGPPTTLSASTLSAGPTALCPACIQQLPDSEFFRELNRDGETLPDINYTVIATRTDEFATPYTTGFLPPGPNVENITLQDVCPSDLSEHMALTLDPVVIRMVLNALDPAHRAPIDCGGPRFDSIAGEQGPR